MENRLPGKYEPSFISKIKNFISNIFNTKNKSKEPEKVEIRENVIKKQSEKPDTLTEMKIMSKKGKLKDEILSMIDENPKLIESLSTTRLKELISMYDKEIEEIEEKEKKYSSYKENYTREKVQRYKKSLMVVLSVLVIIGLTACGDKASNSENNVYSSEDNSKVYSAIECMKKIEPQNTVEEINKIVGFEGELIDEEYNKYYWEFSENLRIEVTYFSGKNGNVALEIDDEELKNKKVDLSKYEEVKKRLNSGITYDEVKELFGGETGTLIKKNAIGETYTYTWVDEKGGNIDGTFNNKDNKCFSLMGSIVK